MHHKPLLSAGHTAPDQVQADGFHLRMLTVHDVIKDFAAVTDAAPRLVRLMSPTSTWPTGLTIEENLIDLGWHQREFTIGHSFAYTVMNPDESRCLGCCYLYKTDRAGFAAEAFYWARDAEFDQALGEAFRGLVAGLPLGPVAWPGRDQPWD